MKKTSKLKSKLCAWFLVCATVLTTLGSSGSMVFADNDTPQPQTETEFSTLSVKSGEGGEISIELPDGQIETATSGNSISMEVETGSTVKATVSATEGYEVSTYRLTTDSGDSQDIDTYDSYSFIISENVTLEAEYNEVIQTPVKESVAPVSKDVKPVSKDVKKNDSSTTTKKEKPEVQSYLNNGEFSITLEPSSNNGVLEFTDLSQTTNVGDTILVSATPDEGYMTSVIKVLNSDTKELLYYVNQSTDNTYEFAMPATNVVVTTSFDKVQEDPYTTEDRLELAEELGVLDKVDEDGYLTESYAKELGLKTLETSALGILVKDWNALNVDNATNDISLFSVARAGLRVTKSTLCKYNYQSGHTPVGSSHIVVDGRQAFCAQHGITRPVQGSTTGNPWVVTNQTIRKVLYYGYTGPAQWSGFNNNFNKGTAVTSLLLSYHYYGHGSINRPINGGESRTMGLYGFYNYTNSASNPPSSYTVYAATTNGGSGQVIMWGVYSPNGSVKLSKSSSNSTLTSGNGNYSLAGAEYTIYSNASCTKVATSTKLTTKSDGSTNTVSLKAGTYYVKETKASKGYMRDNTVHKVTITAGKTATITSKEPPMSVTINLTKVSDNPDVTSVNDLYSLKGAEYSIYSDSACTKYVNKITTDENGKGTITGLPLNTYYVKETKASQGFAKDTKVYTVSAKTGTTLVVSKSITSTETCLMDPVGLLLQKVDAETGTSTPVEEGTLQDAQFEVKLYDTLMTTDPSEAGHTPVWSAVMRTDEDGEIYLLNSYRVSGDEIPTSANDTPSLPYGTITFKEIKSPNGYLINDTVIVKQITGANNSLTTVPQYEEATQEEQPMTLKIIKVQNGTTLRIPDAEFKWTLPDGSTHTYTTDENGEVFFKGLEWGKHTIEEVKVPDGYSVNQNDIIFTVNQDNTITGASGATVTDTDGNFTLVIDEDNLNPTVTYENKPAPFDLHVYKINDVDFVLEGAEFTIYTDKDCTDVWKVGKTDSSGNLTFEDLIVGKTYYMKETDAPQGYRIPINEDGSDIVYKIMVTSTPVEDEFTFYVNDKPYTTLSTGNYKVSGTKADRVCDMTIINERGSRLPETGSSMMLVLLVAGVALMGGAIVVSQTRKSKKENKDV